MNLDDVEKEIYEIYHFFAREAPGVTPAEVGRLGQLWAYFDERNTHGND